MSRTTASSQELQKMVDLIISKDKDGEKSLIRQYTVDGVTPLALALCHPQATEKLVDQLKNVHEKQLLVALNTLANPRRFQAIKHKGLEYLTPFVNQLAKCSHATVSNQLFHIICRHNNKDLLERIYKNNVSIYFKVQK